MRFSEKVHYARIKLGYSQERLAQELHVSFATINRWENGKTEPLYRKARLVSVNRRKHKFDKKSNFYQSFCLNL